MTPGRVFRSIAGPAGLVLVLAALAAACGSYRAIRRLEPESREFISKVRYLVTAEERRIFLNLPAAERPAFQDEFWKKRDPDPETEENEFKVQYFQRIEEANHLFTDGQEPGWLQDRGRIDILLGPPSDRETYPRGVTFYGIPTEIWYYGFFPIIFVDPNWTGNYKLDPSSPIQLSEIMKTQLAWKPQVAPGASVLEFDLDVEKKGGGELEVRIRIPYAKIWMTSGDNKELRTTLTVALLGEDTEGKKIQESSAEFPLSLTEDEVERLRGQEYAIALGFTPRPETRVLVATVANGADKSSGSKRKTIGR